MTAKYKETTVNGNSYIRPKLLHFTNEVELPPSAVIVEEQLTTLSDGTVLKKDLGNLPVTYDPSATFPLLNPTTGEPTTTTLTHADFYSIMYSLYVHVATLRDEALAAPVVEEAPTTQPPTTI